VRTQDGRIIPVERIEGCAGGDVLATEAEASSCLNSDWEINSDGELLFQGKKDHGARFFPMPGTQDILPLVGAKPALKFKPGDKVRLTGKFLRNTGQYTGPDAHGKWTVVEHQGCEMCASGDFVAVNEKREPYPDEDPNIPRWRHINTGNLILVGKPDYSNL
jgi:hypothetical protein